MPAIKIAGRKTGNSKTNARKPAASKASSTRNARQGAKATTRPSTRGTRKSQGTTMSDGRVRRPVTDDQKVINRYIKLLQRAGDERREAKEAHDAAVERVYEVTREAMDAGVPTGIISEHGQISRQWLYKMGDHAGRNGGNGAAKKPTRKSTTAAKHKRTSTAAKRPTIRTR